MTCKKNELKGEKIYVIMNTDQPEQWEGGMKRN